MLRGGAAQGQPSSDFVLQGPRVVRLSSLSCRQWPATVFFNCIFPAVQRLQSMFESLRQFARRALGKFACNFNYWCTLLLYTYLASYVVIVLSAGVSYTSTCHDTRNGNIFLAKVRRSNLEHEVTVLNEVSLDKLFEILCGGSFLPLVAGLMPQASRWFLSQYAKKVAVIQYTTLLHDNMLFQDVGLLCTVTACCYTLQMYAVFQCSCPATCPKQKRSELSCDIGF